MTEYQRKLLSEGLDQQEDAINELMHQPNTLTNRCLVLILRMLRIIILDMFRREDGRINN